MSTATLSANLAQGKTADIEFKVAATQDERMAAFQLVYESYLQTGLIEPNPYQMRVTPYHLLPTTEVFVATCQGETIFTGTLVADGELGLPMESIFGREVALRREQDLFLSEVSCLAARGNQFTHGFRVFLELCRLMVQYARRQYVDELLVAVHPKHARFYQRFMAFELIGRERLYPAVCDHPAVSLSLNFARIDQERPRNYDMFFGQPLPERQLRPHPLTAAERNYLRLMVDSCPDPAPLYGAAAFGGSTSELATRVA